MFLTDTELIELTGYKYHAYQRRWLSEHGYRFDVAAGGRPFVNRAFVCLWSVSFSSQIRRARCIPTVRAAGRLLDGRTWDGYPVEA